jgi:protein-S-isoprenylcysteine O-methyltransferase Ste14
MVIASYVLVLFDWGKVPALGLTLIPPAPYNAGAGMILCGAGVATAIWARRLLAGNWSGNITLKQDHELIQRGPYAWVRHPIYTGLLLMFAGSWLADGKLGALLGMSLASIVFFIKSRQEKALMLRHFPEQYAAYQMRTKRLVPFIF